ncbi:myoneurin [Salarias fasciatus]|uniref:Myoneurin n=1 Tax=Salarias fasciatus TaxID=181472 RepID=A0A672HJK6_SALFA|nr:myoneurin [Salarias fasciatus]
MTAAVNHGKLLLQRLYEQREMDFLCDVTIVVRDVEFRAHRNVLAAFSEYFSFQAERGHQVTTLDPDKVSRYSLEKLLEFVYTGQMNLSSTRQAAVRRAAVFLGMSEATRYLEENPHWSEAGEASRPEAEPDLGPSPPSPASAGSPSSPLPLSIVSGGMDWLGAGADDGARGDGGAGGEPDGAGYSDDEYDPARPRGGGRGKGRKRGRRPRSLGDEQAEPSGGARGRGRGRRKGRRGRGRPRGAGRGGLTRESPLTYDLDAGARDCGDTSADWSPSHGDEAAAKRPRASGGGGRGQYRGRGRGRPRGRDGGGAGEEEEENGGEAPAAEYEGGAEPEDGEQKVPVLDVPLVCLQCNKDFKDVSSLRRHEKIHEGLKPFACIFCSKTFRQATQLKTHLRIHTGEKPFGCADCDKCFAQKCQLVAHRRMHHGEEKPYTCDRCGFKFATSSNYKIHIRLHSGEKPYVCDVCGQAFAQSSTLTYHKRRHTGEKPYQCDLCGMSFSVSSSLIAHARKHTGETPYKCPQEKCDAKFVTSSELKKHMRRLHPAEGNSGVQCLLCGNRFASVKNMIKHQEKAHADEVRQHKERARAVVLLASSHPVAFVQSKFAQETKSLAPVPEAEPANPEPSTPKVLLVSDAATDAANAAIIREFKSEPVDSPLGAAQVTFDPEQEQTINSDTLHALVEQLRPPASPAQSLEQIVIIRTVDADDGAAPPQ